MDVICEAIKQELQLGRMMKEGEPVLGKTELKSSGTGPKGAEPVTQADLSLLTDQMRDMQLFMHRTATSAPFRQPDPVTVSSAGPSGTTLAPIMYWPNWERLISDNPKEVVIKRLVKLGIIPTVAGKEGEVSTHVSRVAGAKWRPPVVAAEVRTIRASEAVGFGERFLPMDVDSVPKNTRAKETPPHQATNPAKKKATELAKKGLGIDHPVELTLKELAIISPLMAGELIKALRECAGPEFQEKGKSPRTADVKNAEVTPQVADLDLLPTSLVLVPLGFVWMKIANQNVWAMINSGSMINIMPTELASAACLTLQKTSTSIRTMGGFKQEVDGLVEKQEFKVAKTKMALSFLVTKALDGILGRPFLFAFNAVLAD
ncbi:hypothetical protein H4Q26_008811 [Puccinia striiformis f. sp. tritici PST-130]|nr:hypothetical protein H4Q26_008811 [Puccinia striiformis f. sp. tritici PST-130]